MFCLFHKFQHFAFSFQSSFTIMLMVNMMLSNCDPFWALHLLTAFEWQIQSHHSLLSFIILLPVPPNNISLLLYIIIWKKMKITLAHLVTFFSYFFLSIFSLRCTFLIVSYWSRWSNVIEMQLRFRVKNLLPSIVEAIHQLSYREKKSNWIDRHFAWPFNPFFQSTFIM